MARWFFQGLEKRIESLGRQHVHFIDNVDLVASPTGTDVDVVAQIANIVDATVTGSVHLQHVDVAAIGDSQADVACVAGFFSRPLNTIQGLGEDSSGRSLADAAGTRKQVGVPDTILPNGIRQSLGNLVLANQLGEELRAVPPCHHRVLVSGIRAG